MSRRLIAALLAALGAVAVAGCGNALQDQPIPHNQLEALLVAPYPVYWLGGTFHGLQITEASRDPGGAFTVQYGDCLEGGQNACVPPLKVVTSPDNSFLPGEGTQGSSAITLRGQPALVAEHGSAIAVRTGGVVLDVYAHTAALALAAAQTAVPINLPDAPGAQLQPAAPNTGFARRPLPSQMPSAVRPPS
jgi:hypothetical protein